MNLKYVFGLVETSVNPMWKFQHLKLEIFFDCLDALYCASFMVSLRIHAMKESECPLKKNNQWTNRCPTVYMTKISDGL